MSVSSSLVSVMRLCVVPLALLLVSCATGPEGGEGAAARGLYEVTAERTSFYRYGPQQGTGPDDELSEGTLVKMVQRRFGYSQVEMVDGVTGWVATDDIAIAPEPEPAEEDTAIVRRYRIEDLEASEPRLPGTVEPAADEPVMLPEFRY